MHVHHIGVAIDNNWRLHGTSVTITMLYVVNVNTFEERIENKRFTHDRGIVGEWTLC